MADIQRKQANGGSKQMVDSRLHRWVIVVLVFSVPWIRAIIAEATVGIVE
jgi:hypothetical protein